MSQYFEVYNPLRNWKQGDYPLSPQVSIQLTTHNTESDGSITFCQYMATEDEIDNVIDFLVKELQKVRKNAKKELKAMHEKQHK